MPEEYRSWKEQMDAAEQKKGTQAALQANSEVLRVQEVNGSKRVAGNSSAADAAHAAAPAVVAVQYASQAEAAEAFKELLSDMKVSTVAKMREVQDLCQLDPRWEALKSQGEKKQALAEYQVFYSLTDSLNDSLFKVYLPNILLYHIV